MGTPARPGRARVPNLQTMKHLTLILATYLALATQAACGTAFAIGDCRLPLMWLPVVLALSWFADARGIVWVSIIGLLADGMSGGRFGIEMLTATLTAALSVSLRPDDDVRSRWPKLVWQFAIIGTGLVLSHGLGSVFSNGSPVTVGSLITLAGEAAIGAGLCALLGVRWLDTALHPRTVDFR